MGEWKGRMGGMKRVRVSIMGPERLIKETELLIKDISNFVCLLTFQNR